MLKIMGALLAALALLVSCGRLSMRPTLPYTFQGNERRRISASRKDFSDHQQCTA